MGMLRHITVALYNYHSMVETPIYMSTSTQTNIIYFYLQMYADNVISLAFGKALIPFQVSVCWSGDGGRAQRLSQEVTLTGVKEPSNFLTVISPSPCTGMVLHLLSMT